MATPTNGGGTLKRLLIVLSMALLVVAFAGSSAFAVGYSGAVAHFAGGQTTQLPAALAAPKNRSAFNPLALRVPGTPNRSLATVGGNGIADAVELPTAVPVTGAVDSASHPDDVYWFYLEAGATIYFSLDATAGTNTELWLYPPTATALDASAIGGSVSHVFPQYPYFTATTAGYYYVDVFSGASGSSPYSLDYFIDSPDNDIPGVAIGASPVYSWLEYNWDWDEVYRLPLKAGDRLTLALDAVASGYNTPDFNNSLFVYGPSATAIYDGEGYRLAGVASSSQPAPATESISYYAPVSGNYYVDVYNVAGKGYSALTWSVNPIRPGFSRTPTKSALTYKRKKGRAVFTLGSRCTNQFALPVKSAFVYLQTSSNGKKWKNKLRLTTNANGAVAAKVTAKKKGKTYFRWYRPATSTSKAAYSGAQKVTIK